MKHEQHSENTDKLHNTELSKNAGFKAKLWDGEGFNKTRLLQSSTPTGKNILQVFDLSPADEYILLKLSKKDGLKEIQIDQEINLQGGGIERFFAFHSDRSYNFSINDMRYPWGNSSISESILRMIGRVNNTDELLLKSSDEADRVLLHNESVDLTGSKVEHIYSHPREWKLNVQGVILCLPTHEILVKDALIQAGFDPNESWTAILKIKGQPKRPVEIDSTIDLTEPGIEKLRLRPNEIKNGEILNTLRKDFRLLDKDEAYLEKRNLIWETFIEGKRRWLAIRSFEIPKGYNVDTMDMVMDVPNTYPAAAMDMFYCSPLLKLTNGTKPNRTDSCLNIEGKQYQQWSRHLNGATRWNPHTDSVISHIAFVEASLGNEVGE